MEKPKKHKREYYNYNECKEYINKKYNINIEDYEGRFKDKNTNYDAKYLNFWHWLIERFNVHNGSIIEFDVEGLLKESDDYTPIWAKEILKLFKDEFGSTIPLKFYW